MIYHFKSLVLVRKGRAFYKTFVPRGVFLKSRGGYVLNPSRSELDLLDLNLFRI